MLIGRMWGASLNAINSSKPPLNEVNVRRALLFATPFAAIIKSVYKGLATQTNSVWGGTKYWDSHVPFYKYDLTKAKALLRTHLGAKWLSVDDPVYERGNDRRTHSLDFAERVGEDRHSRDDQFG